MTEWTARRLSIERDWVSELRLGLRRLRPESGKATATLLYIHGLGESGLTLEAMASDPQLADYDHVVPDLAGYGRSAWPDEAFTLEDHAKTVRLLIEHLDLRDVVLVGHSMGGVIGLLVCEAISESSRERVRAFFNIEGNVTSDDCGFSRRGAGDDLEGWLAGGWRRFVDGLHEEAAKSARDRQVLQAYGASLHLADPRTLLQNCKDLVEVSTTNQLAGRLGALAQPHFYLHGDRGVGARSLGQLRDAGVEIATVGNAGHWPFVNDPATTASVLRRFVQKMLKQGELGSESQ